MKPESLDQRRKELRSGAAPSAMLPTTIREQSQAHIDDPLERLQAVAAELDCSERFLKDEAKRGRLEIIRLSYNALRIRRSEKLRYLAAKSGVAA